MNTIHTVCCYCKELTLVKMGYDDDIEKCDECGKEFQVRYCESYNVETYEEDHWWETEKI